jgi:aminoglycoside 3-N-acetyltransferase
VLLLGVTHSENTTLHVAEAIAHVPYSVSHPTVVDVDGTPQMVMIAETDHCCRRFQLMDGWLRARGLQREGKVGNAEARLCASRDIVAVAVEQLASDPLVFLCPREEGCDECDAARESVTRV